MNGKTVHTAESPLPRCNKGPLLAGQINWISRHQVHKHARTDP